MVASAIPAGLHTAVVRAPDGVRFIATAPDDEGLASRIVVYIGSRCDDVLWPESAERVRRLIAEHRESDAISAYFTNVGQRWDKEWLEVEPGSRPESTK